VGGIQSLIENEGADEWVRGAALSGLVTLVAGQKSRDEIVSYFTPSSHWNSIHSGGGGRAT
jgi:hypothetical protein